MNSEVKIEQIQTTEETIKSTFDARIISKTQNIIKLVYKNQDRLCNLIVEVISDSKILLGTLSEMNELEINKVTNFKHLIDGYVFNCQSKLLAFIFNDSIIEIRYELILDNHILSHNILRILNKN